MTYIPKPLNTYNITLPKDILDLQEQLAENIHELWSQQRIKQGWTYGPKRDDQKKEHPNLVPYHQLSELDKDYDRNTAMGTLKTIMALGYTIKK